MVQTLTKVQTRVNFIQTMAMGTILGDVQLLAVEGTAQNGMNSAALEELKIGLDSIESLNSDDAMKKFNYKQLEKMSRYELSQFTHVVSNVTDFPKYDVIVDSLMIPVVTTQWVKDVIRNKRVIPLRSYSPDPKHFFKDVILAAGGGLQDDDKEVLKIGVKTFGGIYLDDLKKSLTHYVTNDLEDDNTKLIMAFNEYNPSGKIVKIVKVDWIFHSIMQSSVLPESLYSFNDGKAEKGKEVVIQKPDFLSGLNFALSDNLNISDTMRSYFTMFDDGDKAGERVFLTRYLNNEIDKSYKQKTFDYLFSLLFHKKNNMPYDSLLFYPVNRNPISGMAETLIATTNYTGDSRIYIEELTMRMGGKFSKTMKSTNTHLVASKSVGKKFEFAKSWNVKIVNHMWVEDSFKNWKIMDVSEYKNLPRDAKGVRLIGDIEFNGFEYTFEGKNKEQEKVVEHDFETQLQDEKGDIGVLKRKVGNNQEHSASIEVTQSNKKTKMNSIEEKKSSHDPKGLEEVEEKERVLSEPVEAKTIPANPESRVRTRNRRGNEDRKALQEEASTAVKAVIPEEKNPEGEKSEEPDSVWQIQENGEKPAKSVPTKRKAISVEENDQKPKENKRIATKKTVKSEKPYNITAIVTGFDGSLSVGDKRELRKVGINIVENANKTINCIIAPSLLRTQKFLTALSYSPEYFLEPLFLSDVLGTLDSVKKVGDFDSISPKIEKYDIWEHVDYEKDIMPKRLFRTNTTREKAIEYLKRPRKGLFEGFVFNLSPGLAGGFDTLKGILKAFGCKQCFLFKETTKTAAANVEKNVNGVSDVAILVCSTAEKNVQKHFTTACRNSGMKYVTLEWDVIVTAIFEATLDLNSGNVLQQSGVL